MSAISWTQTDVELASRVLALAREASAAQRTDPLLQLRIAEAHMQLDRWDEAETCWRAALELDPNRPEFHSGLAQTLRQLGRVDEALAVANRWAELRPEDAVPRAFLADCQWWLDDFPAALASAEAAATIDPNHLGARDTKAKSLHAMNRTAEAAALLDATEKHTTTSLALHATVLAKLGKMAELESLLDYGRFIHRRQLPVAEPLNTALTGFLSNEASLEFEPPRKATKGGSQGALRRGDHPAIDRLFDSIQAEVESWIDLLGDDHPWLRIRPDRLHFRAWANVLESGGGQRPHIHPSGWISGVYYVEIPESAEDSNAIEFGPSNEDEPIPKRAIAPAAGDLLLFPSWIYHRTQPASGRRISIAFDAG